MAAKHFLLAIVFLLLTFAPLNTWAVSQECREEVTKCHNKSEALKTKIIAIAAILIASMVGVCLPLYAHKVPALQPDKNLFVVVKAFSSGVKLDRHRVHARVTRLFCRHDIRVRPRKAVEELLLHDLRGDALRCRVYDGRLIFPMSRYRKSFLPATANDNTNEIESGGSGHIGHGHEMKIEEGVYTKEEQLLKHRVVAKVLETGIVVHSVVIGLSMGSSESPCAIRPLIAVLYFHQLFEGMGLGGCILQAEFKTKIKVIMVFFFSSTTPPGIALGIALSSVYDNNSPDALIVQGLLNACSAGLLNCMALVNLLAADFMGSKLRANMRLQIWSYVAVLLGAGCMSVMAIWA